MQTACFTGCAPTPCSPPVPGSRATESHPQPRTHSCGNQPASIISLRGASVAYPTKAGSTSFANSRICRLISSIRSSRNSRTSRKEHTRWCNPRLFEPLPSVPRWSRSHSGAYDPPQRRQCSVP